LRAVLSWLFVVGGIVALIAWCVLLMTLALKAFGLIPWGPLQGVAVMVSAFGGLGFALWSAGRLLKLL